jgi:hypothetical protein
MMFDLCCLAGLVVAVGIVAAWWHLADLEGWPDRPDGWASSTADSRSVTVLPRVYDWEEDQ